MSSTKPVSLTPLDQERLALLIERELRYQLDSILERMQNLANDYEIGKEGDKRSPLRNLLVTANDRTASLEIIKNYIKYQIARSEDISKVLKIKRGEKRFGEALIEALDNLKQDADKILECVTDSLIKVELSQSDKENSEPSEKVSKQENSKTQEHLLQYLKSEARSRELTDLHLKLVQLYLGYLVRQHTAMRSSQGNQPEKPKTKRNS